MPSDDATAELIRLLRDRQLTIAAAESLTGGELTAELTRVPGASAVVLGGVVVYATALKHTLVGVDADLLDAEGPVHPEVARQLADGVRQRLAVDGRPADIGLATTGVAGPDPQGGRPVGTVFVGISTPAGTRVVELALQGDRATIRRLVVDRAIAETLADPALDIPAE
ncbi:nicotinamide-nucleotide amidohydrolase family protein [Leifsonia sp. F6_8S_P_1B]|uniref:Nicotinamide-nucleotide amidohydrolase family protein n=1 Tax=Leifsonia williamsii TaxID=3035919 RepID=A0ABT8KE21_9MICO|nr:nicotinamide-nucleotide amidohydrolase family protein [Leifsonia williamsii]MDN4615708.1 nicotinamide-nucleotide amidohydrolase family protein [Leifsonia williamsii]